MIRRASILSLYAATLVIGSAAGTVPIGDTQGLVAAVRLLPAGGGVSTFQVWFSSVSNDRWGCLQNNGFVTVSESNAAVPPDHFKRLFATALTAQATGKELALDSAGANPCSNAVMGWMVN